MQGSIVVQGFGLAGQAERLLALPGPFHIKWQERLFFHLAKSCQMFCLLTFLTKSISAKSVETYHLLSLLPSFILRTILTLLIQNVMQHNRFTNA